MEMVEVETLEFSVVHDTIMQFAYLAASNSPVVGPNGKMGACITNEDDKVVSLGWNGVPKGSEAYLASKDHAVLAVPYAILNVGSARVKNCSIYITDAPTHDCAKLIVLAGITRVIYVPKEKRPTEEELANIRVIKTIFDKSGVTLCKFNPSAKTKTLADFQDK